jgi:hypothetical protein
MSWPTILSALVKIIGFVLTAVVSGGVIFFIYRALSRLLGRLIGDQVIAQALTTLGLVLLGLKGLVRALSYITQDELRYLHGGLTGLLTDMADVIQWLALIATLLFLGYTLRGWRGPTEEQAEEEE